MVYFQLRMQKSGKKWRRAAMTVTMVDCWLSLGIILCIVMDILHIYYWQCNLNRQAGIQMIPLGTGLGSSINAGSLPTHPHSCPLPDLPPPFQGAELVWGGWCNFLHWSSLIFGCHKCALAVQFKCASELAKGVAKVQKCCICVIEKVSSTTGEKEGIY